MKKSFNKFKTLFLAHFWLIPPNFGSKNFFPENLTPSFTTSCGYLIPCQNAEKKLMIQFQENAWTEGWTKRPYFTGPFWLLLGVLKCLFPRAFFYVSFCPFLNINFTLKSQSCQKFLTRFSQLLHFIQKIEWLVSIWNATLGCLIIF